VRAVVYDKYGPRDVLRLEDAERPVPTEDEVLVKIHATTVAGAGGIYLPTDGFVNITWALLTSRIGDKKVLFQIPPRQTKQDVLFKKLIEAGKYRPVIDRTYSLEDVIDAVRYVETEQRPGT
jgi:NADPH:quinone reductase-like Zn-dependent oxidoreductase